MAVIGDLMGPALLNLNDLISLPTGSGENNIVKFTPNAFALKYLAATNQQITAAARAEALQNLKSGG